MSDFLNNAIGKVEKLKFTAYGDDKFNNKKEKFTVQYNPLTFKNSYEIAREKVCIVGSSNSEMKFAQIESPDLNFEFTLDATGASPNSFTGFVNDKNIEKLVNKFLEVCYYIDSETHQPHYIEISYGKMLHKTVFKSCEIKYTLFENDGTPLRAVISAKFQAVENKELVWRKLDQHSPDLTHKRIVKDKDTVIAMSNKIYERNDLYQEVARFNGLNNFRSVVTGSELFFPSLKK